MTSETQMTTQDQELADQLKFLRKIKSQPISRTEIEEILCPHNNWLIFISATAV